MSELLDRASDVLAWSLRHVHGRPALGRLERLLADAAPRLDEPLRVALVGTIKAGKTTALNALVGRPVLPMGTSETTFTVNWLRQGPAPRLVAHYRDGRGAAERPWADLERLASRTAGAGDELLTIDHVELHYPAALLGEMQWIDTPGLASFYQADSRNTQEFLGLSATQLDEATQTGRRQADAVVYAIRRSATQADADLLRQLQGSAFGQSSPVDSLGLLTQVDVWWPHRPDPLAEGREMIARLFEASPSLRQSLYSISPVCAKMALGACLLDEADVSAVAALADLGEDRLRWLLADVRRLSERQYADVPAAPEARRRLFDRLDTFGIWTAAGAYREGATTPELLGAALRGASGIEEFLDLLRRHFGRRASLLKLQRQRAEVSDACRRVMPGLSAADRRHVEAVAGAFEQLWSEESGFAELEALRVSYEGALGWEEGVVSAARRACGEDGTTPSERLGLTGPVDGETIRARAGECEAAWRTRADALFATAGERQVARAAAAACGRLLARSDGD